MSAGTPGPRARVALRAGLLAALALAACRSRAEESYLQGLRAQNGEGSGDPIALFTQAIELDPKQSRYHEVRGEAYLTGGDARRALADLNRAVEIEPRAFLYFERGYAECELGDPINAARDFAEAIREQPENCQFYGGQAAIEVLGNRLEQALSTLDHAIRCDPAGWSLKYQRGYVLTQLHREAEAEAQFRTAPALTCGGTGQTVYFDGPREYQRSLGALSCRGWRTLQADPSYSQQCP
jgi:tetratricopeptide (TPR) repeat protein